MFYGFGRGECLDQKKVVEETNIPIAVVNGADEQFLNLQFIRDLKFGNLWKKAQALGCTSIATGHYAIIEHRADRALLRRASHSRALAPR